MKGNTSPKALRISKGIRHFHCPDFTSLVTLVDHHFKSAHGIIWRGHAEESWILESSLERKVRSIQCIEAPGDGYETGKQLPAEIVKDYGVNAYQSISEALPRFPELSGFEDSETTIWTNARHYGMLTPLLDWTKSPYVAAFFAFVEVKPMERKKLNKNIVLWGLHHGYLCDNRTINNKTSSRDDKHFFNIVLDRSSTNRRMLAQQGLFTYVDPPLPLEALVRMRCKGSNRESIWLEKVTMPQEIAKQALIHLNKMNINYTTLYPDFGGACLNANISSTWSSYEGFAGETQKGTPGFHFMKKEREISEAESKE